MLACTYHVTWSDEDAEFVATVAEYPSLSWLDPDPAEALRGLLRILAEIHDPSAQEAPR